MQICSTCRHWSHGDDFVSRRHGEGYGYCHRINFAYQQSRTRSSPPLASLYDEGGDDATLATMGDFGCVMHEPAAEFFRDDDGA